jgi:phage-related protein
VASDTAATIKIEVTADTKNAQQGLQDVAQKTSTFGDTFKGVLTADLVQNAAAKVWDFGKSSVQAFETAEGNAVKYKDALSRIPGASDEVTKSLSDQAKALASVTTYSAGQTKAGQAVLAGFNLTADQLKTITPLMQDYATKTGKDLPSAAEDLGKAILGQGRALKGIGLDFQDTGTASGNFAELVDGLNGKVGGLAQQMGDTSAGKMAIMENKIGALKVALGAALVPAIEQVIAVLMPLVGWISQNTSWLVPLVGVIVGIVGALKLWALAQAALNIVMDANPIGLIVLAIAALGVAIYAIYKNWDTIWSAMLSIIQGVWNWISSNWPLLLDILLGPFGFVVGWVIQNWDKITNALSAAWNWIKANWPLLLTILLGPFGYVVGWVIQNWSSITNALSATWNWIRSTWSTIQGLLTAPFTAAFDAIMAAFNKLKGFIQTGVDAIAGMWNTMTSGIRNAYNAVARAWNSVHISVPGVSVLGHEVIPGFDFGLPRLPLWAKGAFVNSATLGVLGEAGPEFAAPESLLRQLIRQETGRSGPAVVVQNATFSQDVDVDMFMRRAAWVIRTQGI